MELDISPWADGQPHELTLSANAIEKTLGVLGGTCYVDDVCLTVSGSVDVPEVLPVAAGAFQMGDVFSEGTAPELPVHTVTLSAYQLGKYEVTNQQVVDVYNWANGQGYFNTLNANEARAFSPDVPLLDMAASDCQVTYTGTAFEVESRDSQSMADHPVLEITWYGAAAYCNWLSEWAGLTPVYDTSTWTANFANDGYHLPTEAQWERAAAHDVAAPTGNHWRYGQTSDAISAADVNYDNANPLGLTASPYTATVGWYDGVNAGTVDSPSPTGAYDMSGNVMEWCHDWYDPDYYDTSPATDPTGPAAAQTYRVNRGGPWSLAADYCRTARRGVARPNKSTYNIGFRIARKMPAPLPQVTSFRIDNGLPVTGDLSVKLNNTCSGEPTEYMASQYDDFNDATWRPYSTAPNFTLVAGNPMYTAVVYFKVRNATGESDPVSDSITVFIQ